MTGAVPSVLRELFRLRLAESENLQKMRRPADNITFHSNIPEAADLTVAVVYSIFGVCSLMGNTMLLYVSYKKKMLLKPAEFFIINLAVSDLGMTVSLYPLAVTSSIYHRWLYGNTMCLIYAFCGVLFGICSLATLTILSTVCCLKVCYPLYGNRFGPDHGRMLIAGAWVYALVFACSPLVHWGAYGPEPYGTACCIDWQRSSGDIVAKSYTVVLFVGCYILPCCVITISYTQILFTVRESQRAVKQHVSQEARVGNVQTIIIKLSVAVCIGFFTAWSPYALVSMWAAFGHMDTIPPIAFAIPAMFAKSSTLYNPLVYLLLKPNFRLLLCENLHSFQKACFQRCFCVLRLRRSSYCSILAVTLRSLCTQGSQSNSSPHVATTAKTMVCSSRCSCECCQDTFECFKQYPRHCHVSINTVQLSVQDSVSVVAPPRSPVNTLLPITDTKKHVHKIIVHGRKCLDTDSLEITLETVPAYSKTVGRCTS